MKKLSALILTLVFVLTLSACGGSVTDNMSQNQSGALSDPFMTDSEQSAVSGNASVSAELISRERAIEIALENAKFEQKDVINLTAELDREYGISEWEVEFDKDGFEYSYDINASTGEIIKNSKDAD
ncbi:MAG: PepSY domain-containing protein [Clostridia bacterium]|nr:PepSY domain-containing protein [Clostridia bacterium]